MKAHKLITPLISLGLVGILASVGMSSCNQKENQETKRQAPTLESCRPFRIGLPNLSIVDGNRDGLPDYTMSFEKDKETVYAVSPYNTNRFNIFGNITGMTSQQIFKATQALEVSARLRLQTAQREYDAWKESQAQGKELIGPDYKKVMEQQVPGTQ